MDDADEPRADDAPPPPGVDDPGEGDPPSDVDGPGEGDPPSGVDGRGGGAGADPRTVMVTVSVAFNPSGSLTSRVRLTGCAVFAIGGAVQVGLSAAESENDPRLGLALQRYVRASSSSGSFALAARLTVTLPSTVVEAVSISTVGD